MRDLAGCVHFHSAYSYDCRVPLQTICDAALKAGLDFAILTDHFRLDARADGWERYHTDGRHKVLLLVGEEISPRYNHYLALNISKPVIVGKNAAKAQPMIDAVNAQGGFGFIAHPDHEGSPLVGAKACPWIDWTARGFAGLGIWDFVGDWTSALSSLWAILYADWLPLHALRGPKRQTLARWDQLCQTMHCVAIGECDNHGHRKRFFGFSKQSFQCETAFRAVRTHVLAPEPSVGDAARDGAAILSALRGGASYVSLDWWHDAAGFSFEILGQNGRAAMGGEWERDGATLLEAKIPKPVASRLRIIRNGQTIREDARRPHLQHDVDLP
ncbi:MAG TPA: CehA/McbA family metallohydrolase, partial [Elusimicrobiota bacterium]|nr:CehA/McbA family metallohydrolase [Elusimicrobiota bacterium]